MESAASSTTVRTTLNFTLSPTPRRLMIASRIMKAIAMATIVPLLAGPSVQPLTSRPPVKLSARVLADVDALVMPEQTTANAMRKVTKWMPNALCAYSAAPAACGYLVTSSRYDSAVIEATTNASRNGSQTRPPTLPAICPVTA